MSKVNHKGASSTIKKTLSVTSLSCKRINQYYNKTCLCHLHLTPVRNALVVSTHPQFTVLASTLDYISLTLPTTLYDLKTLLLRFSSSNFSPPRVQELSAYFCNKIKPSASPRDAAHLVRAVWCLWANYLLTVNLFNLEFVRTLYLGHLVQGKIQASYLKMSLGQKR